MNLVFNFKLKHLVDKNEYGKPGCKTTLCKAYHTSLILLVDQLRYTWEVLTSNLQEKNKNWNIKWLWCLAI